MWLDANDLHLQGSYVWSSGAPVNSSLWGEDEPGNADHRCTTLRNVGGFIRMSDNSCDGGEGTPRNIVCSVPDCWGWLLLYIFLKDGLWYVQFLLDKHNVFLLRQRYCQLFLYFYLFHLFIQCIVFAFKNIPCISYLLHII